MWSERPEGSHLQDAHGKLYRGTLADIPMALSRGFGGRCAAQAN